MQTTCINSVSGRTWARPPSGVKGGVPCRGGPIARPSARESDIRSFVATRQHRHSVSRRRLQVSNLTVRSPPPAYVRDWTLGYSCASRFKAKYHVDWDGPILGEGTFGVVRKATDMVTGREYAVKTITKAPCINGCTVRKVGYETTLVRQLGGSLDVGYCYGIWEDDEHVHILLELCRGGDIMTRAEQRGSYSEVAVVRIISSVLRVVAQCHARDYMHRDIKPENFLFLGEADDSPIRAIDFGLATAITPGVDLDNRCGTVHYCAPEVIRYKYGKEADLWSVGVLAYQLLTGSLPFTDASNPEETNEQRFDAILNRELDFETAAWSGLSQEANAFVQNLLNRDRYKRMTADQALEHEWLKGRGILGSVV